MKFITFLLSILLIINCERKKDELKLQCKDFKTGKFTIIDEGSKRRYLLKRSKYVQIEETFDLITNKKIKGDRYYKIIWKNECKYILILDTLKSEHDKVDLYINSMGGYKCLIKKIEKDYAIIETDVNGHSFISKIYKK